MIYIALCDLFAKNFIGIKKKISAQTKVFVRNFGRTYYTSYSGQMLYLMSEEKILEKELAITKQECYKAILKWLQKYRIQRAYIRYELSDKWGVEFFKELKMRGIVFVLEFPTIPYDEELSNKRVKIEDKFYREQLADYVEQCTTYSNYDSVFGIPCISLLNGVDLDQHPVHKIRTPDGKIVLIAVATMNKWHGYERVIKGLADYYANNGTQNIIFRLVGEGPESDKYYQLVEQYKLQGHVEFLGSLEGRGLDSLYDKVDIAIGTLATYKMKVVSAAPIKLRDYCARGIPFIYAYDDLSFSGKEEYALKISNNNRPVDMKEVIDFYNRIKQNGFFVDEMRKYISENCTWDVILEKVVDYYKNV